MEPAKRPSAQELLGHEIFNNVNEHLPPSCRSFMSDCLPGAAGLSVLRALCRLYTRAVAFSFEPVTAGLR